MFISIVRICFSIILIGVGLLTIAFSSNHMDQEMSVHGKMLYGFNAKMGKSLGKKYHMSLYGTGGAAKEDGISEFAISFKRYGIPLAEEEARKLIISCLQDLLEAINSDEELRPYLKTYPFKPENVILTIFSSDTNGYAHIFPNISVVKNLNGEIGFLTEEATNIYRYKTEKYEPYEESIAILKKDCEL